MALVCLHTMQVGTEGAGLDDDEEAPGLPRAASCLLRCSLRPLAGVERRVFDPPYRLLQDLARFTFS